MLKECDLPESYIAAMKSQLGDEYISYISSLKENSVQGLRINTLKSCADEVFNAIDSCHDEIPWIKNGYYIEETYSFTKHPFYYAGLYYIQEPTAMTPVTWLDIEEGDRVLDLCAAPGGKSTQIACKLGREGVLFSNDPSASRCKALLKNIELAGIGNVVVTCAMPHELAKAYPEYFDKILIDAPCSGEGMFRKDNAVLKAYREHGPEYFSPIQKEVLEYASGMLKAGGQIVYSTCTFSEKEDEENIRYFLDNHNEFKLVKMTKLYPHKVKGEGHFVAKLEKL